MTPRLWIINPFLDEEDDDTTSFYSVQSLPSYPPPPTMSHLKLPLFWADAPMAWFIALEAQFRLWRIWSEDKRFCHVTTALDKLSLKKVVHLVVTTDHIQYTVQPYTRVEWFFFIWQKTALNRIFHLRGHGACQCTRCKVLIFKKFQGAKILILFFWESTKSFFLH